MALFLFIFSVQMFSVGVIFGASLASLLGHHYGRRLCLMLLAVPDLASWVMMASSTTTWMMVASRFLSGCAGGGYLLCIQLYVGEITSLDQRAWLLALSAPMTALGVLTMQVSPSPAPRAINFNKFRCEASVKVGVKFRNLNLTYGI